MNSLTIGLNTVWVVLTAAMIFFMEGGFALLEAGFVQSKNSMSIVMKVFVDLVVGVIAFFSLGFGLMFGRDHFGLVGLSDFFLHGSISHLHLQIPLGAFWFFHAAFAVAAVSIISGAVAERMNFKAYILLTAVFTAVIYPLSGHWVWGTGGWLARLGMEDFAGSGVIHAMAGMAALSAAAMVGPRMGKYREDGSANVIAPSNLPLAAIGTFVLWFGWFGFNAGSTLSATAGDIGQIVETTLLASVAGGAATMFYTLFRAGKADPGMTINGILAGLVAITAGCAYVTPPFALLIGAVAGLVMMAASGFVDKLHVDDPVGAVAVHGAGGIVGVLAVGLFATKGGLLTTGNWHLIAVQSLGVLVLVGWGALATAGALKVVSWIVPLRVSEEEEAVGLDIASHGTISYQLVTELSAFRHHHPGEEKRTTNPSRQIISAGD